jgi:type III restriction enzyme
MGFADNPIINSTFEKSQWHFELNQEGQPTGKKLAGRRERLRLPAAQFCTNR